MYKDPKIEKLGSRVKDIIEKNFLCEDSYKKIFRDIVTTFIELRLDEILSKKVTSTGIDVTKLLQRFKKKIEYPEPINSRLNKELQHILNTRLINAKYNTKVETVIEECRRLDIKMSKESLINYFKAKNHLPLSKKIINKYESLFQFYLTLNNNDISSNDKIIYDNPHYYFIKKKAREKGDAPITITIEQAILHTEIPLIRNLIPLKKVDKKSYVRERDLIELFFRLHWRNTYHYTKYYELYFTKGDLWSLTNLAHSFQSYTLWSKREDPIYSRKYKKDELYKHIKRLENVSKENSRINFLNFDVVTWLLQKKYDKWRDISYIKGWDKYWDKKIFEETINTITRQALELTEKKRQTGEFTPKPFKSLKRWEDLILEIKFDADERKEYIDKFEIIATMKNQNGKPKKYSIKELFKGKRLRPFHTLLALAKVNREKGISVSNLASDCKLKPITIKHRIRIINYKLSQEFQLDGCAITRKNNYYYPTCEIIYNSDNRNYEPDYDKQGYKKYSYNDDYGGDDNKKNEDFDQDESMKTLLE